MSSGKTPLERVSKLLAKLDYIRRSEERGFTPTEETQGTSNKFVGRVENIFINLPKPLEWLSFYRHDLPLLMDISSSVQDASIQYSLNKSQTKALAKFISLSPFFVPIFFQKAQTSSYGYD